MTNVSRRNVTKGAMWAVPAVSVASASPAFAASACTSTYTLTCPATPLTLEAGGTPSVTSILAGSSYSGGTYFAINGGEWIISSSNLPYYTDSCKPSQAPQQASGYYLNWGAWGGSCSASGTGGGPVSNLTNGQGTAYQGKLTLASPTGCSPQTGGAGLATSLGIQTSIPYKSAGFDICGSDQNLGTVSVPFTVTYLANLTPIASCHYNMNFTFKTGCQPNMASSYTMTPA